MTLIGGIGLLFGPLVGSAVVVLTNEVFVHVFGGSHRIGRPGKKRQTHPLARNLDRIVVDVAANHLLRSQQSCRSRENARASADVKHAIARPDILFQRLET